MILPDAVATAALGAALAAAIRAARPDRLVVYLEGGLGAGKTCLARGLLAALGHPGRVPSPTYTLVEPYAVPGYTAFHVDLYRLAEASELDYLGLNDELGQGTLLIAEWPERGQGRLPPADIVVSLGLVPGGRRAVCRGFTAAGKGIVRAMAAGRGAPEPGALQD